MRIKHRQYRERTWMVKLSYLPVILSRRLQWLGSLHPERAVSAIGRKSGIADWMPIHTSYVKYLSLACVPPMQVHTYILT